MAEGMDLSPCQEMDSGEKDGPATSVPGDQSTGDEVMEHTVDDVISQGDTCTLEKDELNDETNAVTNATNGGFIHDSGDNCDAGSNLKDDKQELPECEQSAEVHPSDNLIPQIDVSEVSQATGEERSENDSEVEVKPEITGSTNDLNVAECDNEENKSNVEESDCDNEEKKSNIGEPERYNEEKKLDEEDSQTESEIETRDCMVAKTPPADIADSECGDANCEEVSNSDGREGNIVGNVAVEVVGVTSDSISPADNVDKEIPINSDRVNIISECDVTPSHSGHSDDLVDTDSDIETRAKIAELSVVSLESDASDSEVARGEVSVTGSESETDLSKYDGSNLDLTHSIDSDLNTAGLLTANKTNTESDAEYEQMHDPELTASLSVTPGEINPVDTSNIDELPQNIQLVCDTDDSLSPVTHTPTPAKDEAPVNMEEHVLSKNSINQESSAVPHGPQQIVSSETDAHISDTSNSTDLEVHSHDPQSDDQLLSELDCELLSGSKTPMPGPPSLFLNGVKSSAVIETIPEYKQLKGLHDTLQKTLVLQQEEIERLKRDLSAKTASLQTVTSDHQNLKRCHEELLLTSQDDALENKITGLEAVISGLRQEAETNKKNFAAHDAHAKKTIAGLQNEMKEKLAQMKKRYEEGSREKEGMVVKYAQAEQKNIELQSHMHKMQLQMRDVFKEKEQIVNRIRNCRSEKQKAVEAYETKNAELNALKREVEKQKEQTQAAQTGVKWAQNKLKVETDSHKETKWRLEDTLRKLNMAKEETEMIRADCQAMIKTYQESEEVKSNSLDLQLKQKEGQLQKELQEKSDQDEIHEKVKIELETLKRKQKELLAELITWKDKVACMDTERKHQETTLTKFKETLQKQKVDNQDLRERLSELQDTEQQIAEQKTTIKKLEAEVSELQMCNEEMESDLKGFRQREGDNLEFSERTTEKNAHLQSENSALNSKVIGLTAENERITSQYKSLQELTQRLEKDLTVETKARQEETETLSTQLAEKIRCVESLTTQLEEERDENRTLKRRHTANIKDLTRQLHQTKKRLENLENKDAKDSTSMGSRTSSNGSLDTLNNGQPANSRGPSAETTPQEECPPIVEVVEIDKQMLVEKIVRLQRAHARKNEKLEFQEDHINQLLEEVKKKNKLIQEYVMREETGTLAPATRDVNKQSPAPTKAQMSKRMGIMASMYSQHVQDGSMTLDLSLEINHKLQAVLEDTLLKNITLKDNIDTLGAEIARLSQENRRIQLQIQGGANGK